MQALRRIGCLMGVLLVAGAGILCAMEEQGELSEQSAELEVKEA